MECCSAHIAPCSNLTKPLRLLRARSHFHFAWSAFNTSGNEVCGVTSSLCISPRVCAFYSDLFSACTCFFFCVRARVRLMRFYRGRALEVCNFCSHLHDIMTDELIISKFHWMSHMSAKTLLAFSLRWWTAEIHLVRSQTKNRKRFAFPPPPPPSSPPPVDDNKLPVGHKTSFISGTDWGMESRYSAAAVRSPLVSEHISSWSHREAPSVITAKRTYRNRYRY